MWLGDSEVIISSYHVSPQTSHCSCSFTEILVATEPQTVTEKGAFAVCPSTTVKSIEIKGRYYQKVAPGIKNPPANTGEVRDAGLIPRSERSSGGGHGNPLQYSCLENPPDRGVWQVTVYGLARVRHNWSDLAHTSVYTVFCLWDHIKYVLSAFFFFFSVYDFAFSYQCFWR